MIYLEDDDVAAIVEGGLQFGVICCNNGRHFVYLRRLVDTSSETWKSQGERDAGHPIATDGNGTDHDGQLQLLHAEGGGPAFCFG